MTKTRKRMWILAALSTAAVLGLAATKFSDRSIETPEYEVLQRYGEVEIRRYPQMLVAQTSMAGCTGFYEYLCCLVCWLSGLGHGG